MKILISVWITHIEYYRHLCLNFFMTKYTALLIIMLKSSGLMIKQRMKSVVLSV